MRVRTRARELALQFLFQADFHDDRYTWELDAFLAESFGDHPKADEASQYARRLVKGVQENKAKIDALLQAAATNWQVERMATADRAALRIGCYELLWCDDVPLRVAINEAIELAKRYATEQSGSFVNGILDRIRKDQNVTS